jgi:hypothetical protein
VHGDDDDALEVSRRTWYSAGGRLVVAAEADQLRTPPARTSTGCGTTNTDLTRADRLVGEHEGELEALRTPRRDRSLPNRALRRSAPQFRQRRPHTEALDRAKPPIVDFDPHTENSAQGHSRTVATSDEREADPAIEIWMAGAKSPR